MRTLKSVGYVCYQLVSVPFAAGEVCHPQHQEMRVRREVGTDEPVEVVEVEQNSDTVTIPKYVFT